MVSDPDPEMRKAAGKALVQIDPGAVLSAYSRALFDSDEGVRLEAADVVLTLGVAAKPRTADLIAALSDKSPAVRIRVARALTLVDPKSRRRSKHWPGCWPGTTPSGGARRPRLLAVIGAVARGGAGAGHGAEGQGPGGARKSAAVALSKVGEPARPALADIIAALGDWHAARAAPGGAEEHRSRQVGAAAY